MTTARAADAPGTSSLPVVVVGAGPTGVTAALALAVQGVDVLVLERHPEVYALPRAVHLDDEAVRVLQGLGVADAFHALSRPTGGLRLLDASHRVLAEFARSPSPGRNGHPRANLFDQPDLERCLRAQLDHHAGVRLRTSVDVVAVDPGPATGPATVVLEDRATGRVERLSAAAVLGCDGADSLVREVVGARWTDLRATERWLVVDVRCATPLDAWDGVHQVCDPHRAATFLRVAGDRYRFEFALRDGETVGQLLEPSVLAALVRPWTGALPVERLDVLRSSEYVFSARLADRWRRGRVLLLGDAAHQSPPFVGQGLGSGVRDVANLAWKLAAVVHGRAPEALLDTYELERRPHARSLIRLARTAGWAMTGGGGRTAAVRRAALAALCRVPGAQEHLLDRGTPALVRGPLVPRSPARGQRLAGTLVPQPHVVCGCGEAGPLDDVLGPGPAVLTTAVVDDPLRRLAARLDARLLRLDPSGARAGAGGRLRCGLGAAGDGPGRHDRRRGGQGTLGLGPMPRSAGSVGSEGTLRSEGTLSDDGTLAAWLRRGGASTVLLRPDRVVLVTAASASAPGAELERRQAAVLRLMGA